ncbi:hypothetical protein [Ichthyobacterium seriolicida]|uniref:Uncharacterized protein n=1 Tax=Ichthyobacterium seriolicida TaxID=242600 RepID=A0A1J1E2H0_9FLAO|nr:hypothetical protein [Ichthyobacterium seriolicida]BAV95149.1 hypothetical protein JBKA6_1136 [Ichthyobacterium seriolicida]
MVHTNLIESTGGVSQVLEIKRKDKDGNVLVKKSFKVVFIHDTPSNNAIIEPDDFKFTVAASGINAIANFRTLTTARTANSIVKAHYVASTDSDVKNGTETKPFEFQLRIGKSSDSNGTADDSANGELPKTNGATATTYFKADALKLPDGAFIEIGTTDCAGSGSSPTTCDNVNPITGIKKTNGATGATTDLKGAASNAKVEYKFTVVAQDGTTKKYYKLTINANAPT